MWGNVFIKKNALSYALNLYAFSMFSIALSKQSSVHKASFIPAASLYPARQR